MSKVTTENFLDVGPQGLGYLVLRSRYQIGRRSSRLKTFAGIDSTCVSVLSGTIRPIDTGFVVYVVKYYRKIEM